MRREDPRVIGIEEARLTVEEDASVMGIGEGNLIKKTRG